MSFGFQIKHLNITDEILLNIEEVIFWIKLTQNRTFRIDYAFSITVGEEA